jgi:hypothetical protein
MTAGTTTAWNPALYAANAAFVPAPGVPARDPGCGDGVPTHWLARDGNLFADYVRIRFSAHLPE